MFYQLRFGLVIRFSLKINNRTISNKRIVGSSQRNKMIRMSFKTIIFVKIKLNHFVLHFRQIILMRHNEFDLYCSLP